MRLVERTQLKGHSTPIEVFEIVADHAEVTRVATEQEVAAEFYAGCALRYGDRDLERLAFVKHARQLGFSLSAISKLMTLGEDEADNCDQIDEIARANLAEVQIKIRLLKSLEKELKRIVNGCQTSNIDDCYVIESLQDHSNCETAHGRPGK